MWRVVALLVTISSVAVAGNISSNPDPGSFDIEPPLLVPNRDTERSSSSKSSVDSAPNLDPAKLEKQFERAKRNVAGLDRLLKIGPHSNLELWSRRIRFVQMCRAEL